MSDDARQKAHRLVCQSWPHCCAPESRNGLTHAAIDTAIREAEERMRKGLAMHFKVHCEAGCPDDSPKPCRDCRIANEIRDVTV